MYVRAAAALFLTFLPLPCSAADVVGTNGADLLVGTPGADVFAGGTGNDRLFGDPTPPAAPPVALRRILGRNGAVPSQVTFDPVFSPDGGYILFTSLAPEFFEPGKATAHAQIWRHDLASGQTTLFSAAADGTPGDGPSSDPAISPDGRYVAFSTAAGNLSYSGLAVSGGSTQVVRKDLVTGEIVVLSRSTAGTLGGNSSSDPAFSPDGSTIAFTSIANNLVPNDVNGVRDAFAVLSAEPSVVYRVSTRADGSEATGGQVWSLAFSPDSKRIAFASDATNLVDPALHTNGNLTDVFVKDLTSFDLVKRTVSGAVALASSRADGKTAASGVSENPVFSADGTEVLFTSTAELVALDANGSISDVHAKTVAPGGKFPAGTIRIVSGAASGAQGNGAANLLPAVSPDGSRLVFVAKSTNLDGAANNGLAHLFVKDLTAGDGKGAVALLSRKPGSGVQAAAGGASGPAVGPDGRLVAFVSSAADMVGGVFNGVQHIYLADMPAPAGGADLLDGGPGADTMAGGPGNDTYVVDDVADLVFERPGDGTDAVTASVDFVLPPDVEALALAAGATKGTGNEGDNMLVGNASANVLVGLGGRDHIDGGVGSDTMSGGKGDDTYVVNSTGDKVVELAKQGTDTVRSAVSYTLPANVERLVLTGNATTATGNDHANTLVGNPRSNRLRGGRGADVLTGGAGRDVFVYHSVADSKAGKSSRDRILDFDAKAGEIVDLAKVDANARKKGRQSFTFVGSRKFSGRRGELRFSKGLLQGDVDGDRRAEFEIAIKVVRGKFKAKNLKLG